MRSVAEIQAEIEKLSRAEQRKLAQWFAEIQADAWDAQIEEDVNSGRLDHLIAQAESDIAAGRTKPLDEVLTKVNPRINSSQNLSPQRSRSQSRRAAKCL